MRKVYDTARTPYRRLLESGVLPPERQDILAMQYQRLNPVRLLGRINRALEDLWDMATTTSSHQSSVTSS
ncbi:MAG: transposase, partial [Dehalococcoidia bacterium]|nr:transposase [Dehalococcoidia bacterium]